MTRSERLTGMLAYIVGTMEDSPDDELYNLLRPIYETAVKITGEKLLRDYIAKRLSDASTLLEGSDTFSKHRIRLPKRSDVVAAKRAVPIEKTVEQQAEEPKKPKAYSPYWKELIGFEIDRTKHKYTPLAKNSWAQSLGVKGVASAALSKFMLKVSYEMALGVTKETIKDSNGVEREAYSFPGEVYRETKHRFETGDMPQYLRAQINKCVNDKKHADRRSAA